MGAPGGDNRTMPDKWFELGFQAVTSGDLRVTVGDGTKEVDVTDRMTAQSYQQEYLRLNCFVSDDAELDNVSEPLRLTSGSAADGGSARGCIPRRRDLQLSACWDEVHVGEARLFVNLQGVQNIPRLPLTCHRLTVTVTPPNTEGEYRVH